MLEIEIFIDGDSKRIGVISKNGKSECRRFIESLERKVQNRLMAVMGNLANSGIIGNIELFRHLSGKIYEIKASNIRIYCFFFQDLVICTHGCKKPGKKKLKVEIKKAKKLMNELLEQGEGENESQN
ncbi:MAG TPA: type II toxin-antitoxin system RelE/ParE family toxin [Candidatus Glassbacteria bacterium]|nr:type II toxin-antitoxin system RelE/ParE family toxin [Candidatus Glassbacteria bacterium]